MQDLQALINKIDALEQRLTLLDKLPDRIKALEELPGRLGKLEGMPERLDGLTANLDERFGNIRGKIENDIGEARRILEEVIKGHVRDMEELLGTLSRRIDNWNKLLDSFKAGITKDWDKWLGDFTRFWDNEKIKWLKELAEWKEKVNDKISGLTTWNIVLSAMLAATWIYLIFR